MSTHLSEFDLAPMSFVVRHLRRVRSVPCVFQSRDTDIIGVLVSQRGLQTDLAPNCCGDHPSVPTRTVHPPASGAWCDVLFVIAFRLG